MSAVDGFDGLVVPRMRGRCPRVWLDAACVMACSVWPRTTLALRSRGGHGAWPPASSCSSSCCERSADKESKTCAKKRGRKEARTRRRGLTQLAGKEERTAADRRNLASNFFGLAAQNIGAPKGEAERRSRAL